MTPDGRPVIAINALAVNPSNAGSRTMLTMLVPALTELAPHLRLLLICHRDNRPLYDPDLEDIVVDLRSGGLLRRLEYDLFGVSRLVKGKADVLVTPGNVGPLRCPVPQVAIVAAHLVLPSCQRAALPEQMPWLKRRYLGWPFKQYLKGATSVLGISEFVARGVVDELGIDAAKVRAMPLGFAPPAGGPTRAGRNNDVLFVGTLYRYKDGDLAVRAFAQVRDQLPADSRLLIVGKDHNGEAARLDALIRELGIEAAVDIRGSVESDELERLYRTSGVLLMPSKGEGFGLPVAEAMGYGLPVIAANATALPEVVGTAAVLVPVSDVDGFARALVDVLTDPARREAMTERGIARAAELTWDAGAIALRDAIEDALAATGRVR